AAAADVFQEYGLDRQAWADSFVNSLADATFYTPGLSAKLKSVPPGQRAAVVNALGAAAKAFVGTPEFKASYGKEYEASLPDDLRPPRSTAEIEKSMRAEMQKGLAEMEAAVKDFQGDMRKQAEAALVQVKGELKQQLATVGTDAARQAAEEKARYEEAKSRPPDPGALSADPRVSLRKALKSFLDETSGVDFAAQTKTVSRTRRFERLAYESKPRAWKACYRAGREACDAARAFAAGWLGELK
ncbi:MAG: hypothetical protein HY900_09210, partial [Deltaproteobacteria bacterium]|nr:hypothetical protein [Deltaproteobacteria bacterium]